MVAFCFCDWCHCFTAAHHYPLASNCCADDESKHEEQQPDTDIGATDHVAAEEPQVPSISAHLDDLQQHILLAEQALQQAQDAPAASDADDGVIADNTPGKQECRKSN